MNIVLLIHELDKRRAKMAAYGMKVMRKGTIEDVKPLLVEALKSQGWGILTEIDVQKTMKEKIGADYEPFLILGACNPPLANQALSVDRAIGLLLPCNVTMRQVGGEVEVSIIEPEAMFSVVEPEVKKKMESLPIEAKKRLTAVLDQMKQ
jgi:uncharacterized protein (DUF302 family)